MVRYLQSRLNDLRDENLTLRERVKSSNYLQQHMSHVNNGKTFSDNEYVNCGGSANSSMIHASSSKNDIGDDENLGSSLYTPSLDGDDQLESKNELLQQKLNELQKLQMQLNSVH